MNTGHFRVFHKFPTPYYDYYNKFNKENRFCNQFQTRVPCKTHSKGEILF